MSIEPDFYTDKDVALKLRLSRSWVRVQRHLRRKGEPHTLDVDARYVGSSPRYVKAEIDEFVARIAG